jgi:hypothetical protein
MDEASPKSKLLTEIEQEWANIERICFSLPTDDLVKPGVQGEWSVKDILAHLSAWEKYLLDRLGYVMTGQPPLYPVMTSMEDVNRFNAQVYSENKDRPLASVVIEFRNLYKGIMTVLEALDEDQLNQPYTYDFPNDTLSLLQLIRANTCEHYGEHCITLKSKE